MLNFTKEQFNTMNNIIKEKRDYGNILENNMIMETAYQLTAYEKYGTVNVNDLQSFVATECLNDLGIDAYNRWCEENSYYDDMIYRMNEIDEILEFSKPWEILRMAHFGNFNPMDEYFGFNGYANLVSYSDYDIEKTDRIIDQYELKTFMLENEIMDYFSSEEIDLIQAYSDNANSIIACANYLISEGF